MNASDQKTVSINQSIHGNVPLLRQQLLHLLGEHNQSLYPSFIEAKFPRVLVRIIELWGKPELDAYFDSLMVVQRSDSQGYPDEVAAEVFRLSSLYSRLGLAPKNLAFGINWSGIESGSL